jgi:Fatty acid hydroxylase superfamily
VLSPTEIGLIAFDHGRAKKRNNAIVAFVSGAIPGLILSFYFHPTWARWLIGIVIGLVWGNGFEYAYHRWLLHRPHTPLGNGHLQHHVNVGTAEEPEHVTLGRSPLHIFPLFLSNGLLVIALDRFLGLRLTSGIMVGWTVYLIAAEEIHWRIHLRGWLPPGLRFARAYHMSHHDIPNVRYNVFLPLFDWILGSSGNSGLTTPAVRVPR